MTVPNHCKKLTSVSKIKLDQFGQSAVFLNPERNSYIIFEVDGCILQNELAADYVLSRVGVGDVIVELKGKDVEHAIKQAEATATYWRNHKLCQGKLTVLIVSTQYPKASTQARKAQERFAKLYKGPLHVVTKNYVGNFESAQSFKGPHKPE